MQIKPSIRTLLPLLILLFWLSAIVISLFVHLPGDEIHLEKLFHAPEPSAWLGYDELGRSIWYRLVLGAKTSFSVAFAVVIISLLIGLFLGSLSALLGGWLDHLMVRIFDIFLAFPGILLAIALAGVFGPGIENVVMALCLVGWVGFARLARAQVLSMRSRDHVFAAIALGAQKDRILIRHLFPLILSPIIVEASYGIASVIIAEAGLSFLGLGVQAPQASWGSMIKEGSRFMLIAPHMVFIPGVALALVVFAVNMLGDQLRDALDVRV